MNAQKTTRKGGFLLSRPLSKVPFICIILVLMDHRSQYIAVATISVIIGVFVGVSIGSEYFKPNSSISYPVREDSPQYKFINPLLFTENGPTHSSAYSPLETIISNYIATAKKRKDAKAVSVYFRDMNTGQWTGVNEEEKYEPSSMMKVLLLLADFKLAEKNPGFLIEKEQYEHKYSMSQHYKPTDTLSEGKHSIQELLNAMIVDSDNDAANALFDTSSNGFKELYQALQLPTPNKESPDYMSAKSYSAIFRVLYNSSYLSRDMSEKALNLLSLTKFNNGLVSGLPKDIRVSHKFGENIITYTGGTVEHFELHDCGIVYYPSKPYFICIMTKGDEFSKLESVISAISNMVYTSVKVSR